jgi:predicted  nucleic acid-binding Zn-ribbon protein
LAAEENGYPERRQECNTIEGDKGKQREEQGKADTAAGIASNKRGQASGWRGQAEGESNAIPGKRDQIATLEGLISDGDAALKLATGQLRSDQQTYRDVLRILREAKVQMIGSSAGNRAENPLALIQAAAKTAFKNTDRLSTAGKAQVNSLRALVAAMSKGDVDTFYELMDEVRDGIAELIASVEQQITDAKETWEATRGAHESARDALVTEIRDHTTNAAKYSSDACTLDSEAADEENKASDAREAVRRLTRSLEILEDGCSNLEAHHDATKDRLRAEIDVVTELIGKIHGQQQYLPEDSHLRNIIGFKQDKAKEAGMLVDQTH